MADQRMQMEIDRKVRSMARLRNEGVPVIEHLPSLGCDPSRIQSAEDVARRANIILLLALFAEPNGMPRNITLSHLDLRGLRAHLTPGERSFLNEENPSEKLRGPFTWQYESANILLWALGYIEALGSPTGYCVPAEVSAVIATRTVEQMIEHAKYRTADEMFDEADLIFRYHWAARDAALRGQAPPAGLIHPVCYYRHYAFNWLIDCETDWDHVDTST